ncbi:hypothetical protein WKI40_12255 [Kosakonia sacchari]|uniref:hypothetical protein n=1 Tax=Kosakonia TaxID=1330547 RepID=UPI00190C12D7|nr:hypothetical protein [Kosakonia sp. LAM2021]
MLILKAPAGAFFVYLKTPPASGSAAGSGLTFTELAEASSHFLAGPSRMRTMQPAVEDNNFYGACFSHFIPAFIMNFFDR